MRISEFAKANGLAVDTVRYYMDLNLIRPIRRGRYFYFERVQQEELERILELKRFRFSLNEIKSLLLLEQFKEVDGMNKGIRYEEMLTKQLHFLKEERETLSEIIEEIEESIVQFQYTLQQESKGQEKGIPFGQLADLCCPKCKKPIFLAEGKLRGNGIYEGKSTCSCGYLLEIVEGIIVTPVDETHIIDPYEEPISVEENILEASEEQINFMMTAYMAMVQHLLEEDLSHQVILSMKTGLGVLETFLMSKGAKIGLLIMVDNDLKKLKVAKSTLEKMAPDLNALYICSELENLPLKEGYVDIAIDALASFLNGFTFSESIYEKVMPLLKQESKILEFCLYFKKFEMLSRLEERFRPRFDGQTDLKILKQAGYEVVKLYEEDTLKDGPNVKEFFEPDDVVHGRVAILKREKH